MDYRTFDQTILLRLDKGEEIVSSLLSLAKQESLTLASIQGLGAVGAAELGLFHTKSKAYHTNTFLGDYEIVSLVGTLTTQNNAPYLHLHLAISNAEGNVFGGHLTSATVSATAELVITKINGTTDRQFDPTIGLNLLHFKN